MGAELRNSKADMPNKQGQTGQVVIPVDDWLYFFEARAFLKRDGGHREIYCAIGRRYLLSSKTLTERKAKKRPTQSELFE
jgi:hypothetical protein